MPSTLLSLLHSLIAKIHHSFRTKDFASGRFPQDEVVNNFVRMWDELFAIGFAKTCDHIRRASKTHKEEHADETSKEAAHAKTNTEWRCHQKNKLFHL